MFLIQGKAQNVLLKFQSDFNSHNLTMPFLIVAIKYLRQRQPTPGAEFDVLELESERGEFLVYR